MISLVLLLSLVAPISSTIVFAEQGGDRTLSGIDIAAGANHSLLLRADGTVVAWGDNSKGQSTVPTGLNDVIAIAAGDQHSLALKSDGTVIGWGSNENGQIDIPAVLATGKVVAIAAGRAHSVAVTNNGKVVVWGDNTHNLQTIPNGISTYNVKKITTNANHILAVSQYDSKFTDSIFAWGEHTAGTLAVPASITDVTAIQSGNLHSLALNVLGEIEAWGDNSKGQLNLPIEVASGGVIAIAAGGDYSLALKSDGTIAGWGENDSAGTDVPMGITGVRAIAVGDNHALALTSDGTVVAWGDNSVGQLNVPASIKTPIRSIQLAAGDNHALALKSNGTLIGWGNNDYGQSTIPAELASGGVKAIAAGGQYSMALKTDGHLVVWGNSGAPYYDITTLPSELASGGIIAIAAGYAHALALKDDGTVVAWGSNVSGQTDLPTGSVIDVQAGKITAIAAGGYHSIALNARGYVAAWGNNDEYQAQVPSLLSIGGEMSISAGRSHSFSINSGYLNGWGYDYWGQISVPAEAALGNVIAAVGGHCYSAALLDDGTVKAWGCPGEGQTNVPVGLTGVVALYGAEDYTLALKSDGTIIGWGINRSGVLDIPVEADPPVPSTPPVPPSVSLSGNAQLASLKVLEETNELTLSPIFAATTVDYEVKTTAELVNLEFAAAHPQAVIKHAGKVITSTVQLDLALGNNIYLIEVYAEDGTMKKYSINIEREAVSKPACLFTDIINHWAKDDICEAVELGIAKGVSELIFDPNRDVTRTDFAVMLVRLLALSSQKESGLERFSDYTHIPQWAQDEMNTAILAGIIEGYPSGQLLPLKEVNRAEMARLIVNAMQGELTGDEGLAFKDTEKIPYWAKSYVNTAYERGIVHGRSGNLFVPRGNTTRAEAAVIMLRLWKSQQH